MALRIGRIRPFAWVTALILVLFCVATLGAQQGWIPAWIIS